MKVPNKLECAYCIRHHIHGGECEGKKRNDENTCLIFKLDPKGCIRNGDFKMPVSLFKDVPPIYHWTTGYTINNIDTEIRINIIKHISWDKERGYLYLHCNCDYYINEYHEDYREPTEKPKLKIIK